MAITVKVKKLHEDAIIPTKAYSADAGFDLYALEKVFIDSGRTKTIRTGLAFELPVGYEMQIRPRSGITSKTNLRVQLGTVDSGYIGEVGVITDNTGMLDLEILKGTRIAQAVIQKIPHVVLYEVDELSTSNRGENGFGSSGV